MCLGSTHWEGPGTGRGSGGSGEGDLSCIAATCPPTSWRAQMCLTPRQHRCEGLGAAPEGHTAEQMGWEEARLPWGDRPTHVVVVVMASQDTHKTHGDVLTESGH